MDHFPEMKELTPKMKKQIKQLAHVKFLPPQTVIAAEGDLCDHIHLVIGGRVDIFRKLKEHFDKKSPIQSNDYGNYLHDEVTAEQSPDIVASIGEMVATKYPTQKHPCKVGEENVLLGIANSCSYVT